MSALLAHSQGTTVVPDGAGGPGPARYTLIREMPLRKEAHRTIEGLAASIEQLRRGRGLSARKGSGSWAGCDTQQGFTIYAALEGGGDEWLGFAILPWAEEEAFKIALRDVRRNTKRAA